MEIVANNLAKRFERNWLFRGLTHTFEPHKKYAIIGANGSGKSTLLQILAGFIPPTSGQVNYFSKDGKPISDPLGKITFASPAMELIEEFTLHELLHFHYRIQGIPPGQSIATLADKFQLTHALRKPIRHFSSGMKQRVKLGLAFYSMAEVIFIDEPTTNLDKKGIEWYRQLLLSAKERCVLIASNLEHEYAEMVQAHIDIQQYR